MSRRLLGPVGGSVLFLLIAASVFAGLGWVTVAALRVEDAQRQAAAEARRASDVRDALRQLDGKVLHPLLTEDNRPYYHYLLDENADTPAIYAPLLPADLPDWMRVHVHLDPAGGWQSPQVPPHELESRYKALYSFQMLRNITPDRAAALGDLKTRFPPPQAVALLARGRREGQDSTPTLVPGPADSANGRVGDPAAAPPPPPIEPPKATPAAGTVGATTAPAGGATAPTPAGAVAATAADGEKERLAAAGGLRVTNGAANSLQRDRNAAADAKSYGRNYGMGPAEDVPAPRPAPIPAPGPSALRQAPAEAKPADNTAVNNDTYRQLAGKRAEDEAKSASQGRVELLPSSPRGNVRGGQAYNGVEQQNPLGRNPVPQTGPQPAEPVPGPPPGPDQLAFGSPRKMTPGSKAAPQKPDEKADKFYADRGSGPAGGPAPAGPVAAAPLTPTPPAAPPAPGGPGAFKDAGQTPGRAAGFGGVGGGGFGGGRPTVMLGGGPPPTGEAEHAKTGARKQEQAATEKRAAPTESFLGVLSRFFADPSRGGERGEPAAEKAHLADPMAKRLAEKGRELARGGFLGRELFEELKKSRPAEKPGAADGTPGRRRTADDAERDKALKEVVGPDPKPADDRRGLPAVVAPPGVIPAEEPVNTPAIAVHLGSMRPQWLTAADGSETLILARAARREGKVEYQGVVLDWPKLRAMLLGELGEQFPAARLLPVKDPTGGPPERTMTALPVQLDPGPTPEPPPAGWTPLRIGLVLAWAAAVLAFAAVGLSGWSLMDLAERRIRFVSAVTHELRTPLTSLRLYLDLLLSGMVQDEQKRQEYLATLNAESDRLHRLIDNVLDFARLERNRTQTAAQPVKVCDLLEQVRETWADRCESSGKELVAVCTFPEDGEVCTDPRLVQQIVGNLIDNARKYAKDAADRRIWLWAKPGGRGWVVFEVEDRGPGVTTTERRSIFRPFRRGEAADTIAGGAGLGLALAKQWAEALGGRLAYRPADGGVGACFRLELRVKGC